MTQMCSIEFLSWWWGKGLECSNSWSCSWEAVWGDFHHVEVNMISWSGLTLRPAVALKRCLSGYKGHEWENIVHIGFTQIHALEATEIECHQTRRCFSSLLVSGFIEPVHTVFSLSFRFLSHRRETRGSCCCCMRCFSFTHGCKGWLFKCSFQLKVNFKWNI